jgi:serine/threonine protein phosphatase PrpC
MFCVFDGHVDKDCGQALVTSWPSVWKKMTGHLDLTTFTDLRPYLHEGFLAVDRELREYEYCGSTMTVLVMWEGPEQRRYLQAANVGDSLAFLFRGGLAIDLSEVHCAREIAEQQRLRAAGAVINDGASRINGLSVTRAIGDHFVKEVVPGFTAEPFVSPAYQLTEDDTHVVVASDGLWDVITGQEAFDIMAKEPTASRMSHSLLRAALSSRKCTDNVTVCSIIL